MRIPLHILLSVVPLWVALIAALLVVILLFLVFVLRQQYRSQQQLLTQQYDADVERLNMLLEHAKVNIDSLQTALTHEQQLVSESQKNIQIAEQTDHQNKMQSAERLHQLQQKNAILMAKLDDEIRARQELQQGLNEQKVALRQEFENLSNRLFDEKQQQFSQSAKQNLDTWLSPLRSELGSFRKRVDDIHSADLVDRNHLKGQIEILQQQTLRIGDDAVKLANALKGDNKAQGNWGEMVLTRLLEESGLEAGREYQAQASYTDESGHRKQPDVVIHLPENKDIVIDSKVSLVSYERYFKAENDQEKAVQLAAHVQSLRQHVQGLSQKSYDNLNGIRSLDFVFLFVPIEAAYMSAMQAEPSLFQNAYDRGVVIVCPTTLMASLRTVANIWRFEKQNRYAQEIAEKAGALHDQFALVVESLDDAEKLLGKAQQAFTLTRKRLSDGRGNLINRIHHLKKLGAKAKKELPPSAAVHLDEQEDSLSIEKNTDEQ